MRGIHASAITIVTIPATTPNSPITHGLAAMNINGHAPCTREFHTPCANVAPHTSWCFSHNAPTKKLNPVMAMAKSSKLAHVGIPDQCSDDHPFR